MLARFWLVLLGFLVSHGPAASADVNQLIKEIKAVSKEGAGNPQAARAWHALVRHGPEALIAILTALDDATPIPANWLRSAVDAIAEKTLADGKPLPGDPLNAFVLDTSHSGRGRRLAYEWLTRIDPSTPGRLLPGMLDDPGAELRRDAVDVLMKNAQKSLDEKNETAARQVFKNALHYARERDQVKLIAERLKKLGVDVDLTAHFGFLTRWMVAGPFDNSGGKGFAATFGPEKSVDLKASYTGKDEKTVHWSKHVTTLPLGVVDFNKVIAHLHGTTAFAYTEVEAPATRPVELRTASNNALRIYLNGKEIFFREEYHHGKEMDQHVGRGTLRPGRNEILVKVCQNEQTDSWAQDWGFQLRICDALGGAVPVRIAVPD